MKNKKQSKTKKELKRPHNYREYLKSDHWQTRRLEILDYYKHKCWYCKSTKSLEVHHLNYKCLFKETVYDVRVLCKECHEMAHWKTIAKRKSKEIEKPKELKGKRSKLKTNKEDEKNIPLEFGPYAGRCLESVPTSYLEWLLLMEDFPEDQKEKAKTIISHRDYFNNRGKFSAANKKR